MKEKSLTSLFGQFLFIFLLSRKEGKAQSSYGSLGLLLSVCYLTDQAVTFSNFQEMNIICLSRAIVGREKQGYF